MAAGTVSRDDALRPEDDAQPATPLRVAFDTGPLAGHRTGVGTAVRSTLDSLLPLDDIVTEPYLLSFRSTPAAGVRRLPLPAALAHRWWQHRAPAVDRLLGRPDLVHGTNYVVPPVRCPRLVSVYDCWFLEHPDDVSSDVARAAAVLRRSVADGAHVVTCSEATTQRVRDLLDTDRVTTVLLGPPEPPSSNDAWPTQLRDHEGHPFILSLGTVERRKNVPLLVAAFGRLAAEHPTARLVIAGAPGNDQPAVDDAIGRLDSTARSRIVQLGPIEAAVKDRLLHNASALGYVSLDEGFGFPLLEAQQVGLPIVTSTAGSIPEVAGSAALFSAHDDTDAVAANLHLAITSDTVRAKLAHQGARNLERFSWASTGRQLADLYLTLANGTR